MTLSICEAPRVAVLDPSDKLRAAKEAADAAKAAYDVALEQLHAAMADEMKSRPGVGTTEMARYLNYSSGHVRRLAKERGVPPKADVSPPSTRRRKATPPADPSD